MSRSLRSRIPETVAPSTRVCVSINLSIYLSILQRDEGGEEQAARAPLGIGVEHL